MSSSSHNVPSSDEEHDHNPIPDAQSPRKRRRHGLRMGPRKRPSLTDPLVHHGRHFGRTVYALCNVQALIINGLLRSQDDTQREAECYTAEERREHKVFQSLLAMVPNLEQRIIDSTQDELAHICAMIQTGVSNARADDTKGLKGAILHWITPHGVPLTPPLSQTIKIDRGFHHERTGQLLCPAEFDWSDPAIKAKLRSGELLIRGDQWPIFLYRQERYDEDDPWNGLLRSEVLVCAYKYIFTSPSSVEKENKATRSGNARIHGMTQVTIASIAYVATQARFALTASAVFSRTDTVTDSERFYYSLVEFLGDPDEQEEVSDLLVWWNRCIFPSFTASPTVLTGNSALAKIKERRARLKAAAQG